MPILRLHRAKQVLQDVYPDREVVMIPLGREILLGGGNVHCITDQQPAVEQRRVRTSDIS